MKKYFLMAMFFCLACQKNQVSQQAQVATEEWDDEAVVVLDKNLSPMDSIKNLDKEVAGYKLGQNLTEEEKNQNVQLKRKIIRGTFDIKELCKLSLGSHWDTLDSDKQKEFVKLMTQLLEKKAIFSKEQVRTDKIYDISYVSEDFIDDTKSISQVKTRLVVPKEKFDLNIVYKLKLTENGWRIFDVIVDDASLVENYKYQFNTIITNHGFSDLVSRMQKKLDSIK